MTIYFCLDDRGGMLFNNRRLSRDAAVLADIAGELPGVLTIEAFSEKLVASAQIPYEVTEEPAVDDQFFLEARTPEHFLPLAKKIVIYRWNRHYPSDVRWEETPADYGFTLLETSEFTGKSHETITKEVYVK